MSTTLLMPVLGLAADADAYEPDDTYTTATPITVGAAAQQHTIAPAGDQDWVSFSVNAGDTYMIRTASGTPFEDIDVVLYLYDSDGTTLLAESDSSWSSPPDELIEYTATADKTVYSRVIGYDNGATGAYSIRVVLATDAYEPDDSYGAATPITVDAAAQQHTIYPEDDEDWVSFSVSTGRVYRISTTVGTLEGEANVYVYLYDSDGTTQLDYADDNWSSPDELIMYTATADKTVYVRVGAYYTGAYSLRVELLGDSYEPDGSAGTATPITVGGAPQQHTLDPKGDQDWLSFEVAAGLTYRVSSGVEGPDEFTRATLFDSDGVTEIYDWFVEGPVVDYKADSNKTIYARITGYYADEGAEYEVSVVVISDDYEPDDSFSTAKPITVNGAVQERSLLPVGDEDWVSFPVTRGWRYTIEVGPGTPPDDADKILQLYDSDGTTEIDSNYGGQDGYSRIIYTAETGRTLYARVTSSGWSESTYTLSVTAIPVPLISVTQSVDFGTVVVGDSLQKTITISNVGAAPLLIGDAQLVGTDFFIVSGNPSGVTIAPDESRDVVVRYSPTIAYSGAPSAVKRSYTDMIAQYNYVEGSLYSISLYTSFENLGGSGDLAWHVRVGGVDSTGSSAVVAGGKYIMEVVVRYSTGTGMVEVLHPVTQNFELEKMLGSLLNVAYIRVPDASLSIASNAANETEVSVGMFGTAQGSGDMTAPTVPQGVSASAVSSTAIQVSWSASSDASGIKHYLVYDAASDLLKATVTGTSAIISGLTPSTSYSFYVKAVDNAPAANTSGASTIAQATTLALTPNAPVAANDSYTTPHNTKLTVSAPGVLGNDTDADGDALTAHLVSGPATGSLTLNANGSLTYTPATGFSGTATFTYRAFDGTDYSNDATVVITVQPTSPDPGPLPAIIKGDNRYETAIAGSKAAYPDGAPAVVIATGESFADALGGAGLAGALDSPLLLTQKASLPGPVMTEVLRLKAKKAYILGGTGAVSGAVESALKTKLGNNNVIRIAGANRYQTAERVAAETIRVLNASGTYSGDAFVATGANFPDALGASPIAAAQGMPVFLADPARSSVALPASVKRVWITGGTAVVSPAVETSLRAGGRTVARLAGADRFATAAQVAVFGAGRGMHWNGVGITTGMNFPDALAAGPVLGSRDAVMLLTDTNAVPAATRNALSANKTAIDRVTFFGGDAAVPPSVRTIVLNLIE